MIGFSKCKVFVLILMFLLGVYSAAWAARPLSTDNAPVVEIWQWEIEEGFEYEQPRGGGGGSISITTSLKYGIFPNLDIGIEAPYSGSVPVGFADATFKLKYEVSEDMALGLNLKLANGDVAAGLGSGHLDYQLIGIWSKEAGTLAYHFNLGYTLLGKSAGSNLSDTLLYKAALEYPLEDFGALVVEIGAETQSDPSISAPPLNLLLGVIKLGVAENLILDLGIDFGLSEASSVYKLLGGLTVTL